MKLLALHEL